jgi:hypothetical protein
MAFERADIQALPFPDASFNTVVDTFSLCVYPDPAQVAIPPVRSLCYTLSPSSCKAAHAYR